MRYINELHTEVNYITVHHSSSTFYTYWSQTYYDKTLRHIYKYDGIFGNLYIYMNTNIQYM